MRELPAHYRRNMFTRSAVTVGLAGCVLIAGCSDDAPVASDLAPSQTTASTVPAPTLPPPCDAALVSVWTARVEVGTSDASPVIRFRNEGDVECEVNVEHTEFYDRQIAEPDAWLDPGGWADLSVGASDRACGEPVARTQLRFVVSGQALDVPTAEVASCAIEVAAFAPVETAGGACSAGDLDSVVVPDLVLVRHGGDVACTLGRLTSVVGNNAVLGARPAGGLEITDLGPGDVVAFGHGFDEVDDCDGGPADGVLTFDSGIELATADLWCGAVYELGAGKPYFGDPASEFAMLVESGADPIAAILELDPFDDAGEGT
jgi:hypothetical protein